MNLYDQTEYKISLNSNKKGPCYHDPFKDNVLRNFNRLIRVSYIEPHHPVLDEA